MPARRTAWVAALVFAAAMTASSSPAFGQEAVPPNILIVVTDDQRYGTVIPEVMPKTRYWFADRGTFFDKAFVSTPLCCPARSSIFTGRYPTQHRREDEQRRLAPGSRFDVATLPARRRLSNRDLREVPQPLGSLGGPALLRSMGDLQRLVRQQR